MKYIAIIILILITGCDKGHPVSSDVFKNCIDAGGNPDYRSGSNGTFFDCVKPTIEKEKWN